MATWTNKGKGTWATKDGRWTASARWNSIQGDHWVLLIGDWKGQELARRNTLREIKALVADQAQIDRHIEAEERRHQAELDRWQAKLAQAEALAGPGQQHMIERARRAVRIHQTNLDRFRKAVADQKEKSNA